MEGAVESGKAVANLIIKKYNLGTTYKHNHVDPLWIRTIQSVDDSLYQVGMPNIINIILFMLIIVVIVFLVIAINSLSTKN